MRIKSFSHKDGTLLLSVSDSRVRARLKGLFEIKKKQGGGYFGRLCKND